HIGRSLFGPVNLQSHIACKNRNRFWVSRGQTEVLVVKPINRHDHENRDRNSKELRPVLECLYESNPLHPAQRYIEGNHRPYHQNPGPIRAFENQVHGDAGALHLRHGVEEADKKHERDGHSSKQGTIEAALGEVWDGVRTKTTEWTRDKEQKEQVTRRVAD